MDITDLCQELSALASDSRRPHDPMRLASELDTLAQHLNTWSLRLGQAFHIATEAQRDPTEARIAALVIALKRMDDIDGLFTLQALLHAIEGS